MANGIGIGLRPEIRDEVDTILSNVDFIECNMQHTVNSMKEFLDPFINKLPILIHSLSLSLGSSHPPSADKVDRLDEVVKLVQPSWVSEHLSFSRSEDIEIFSFIPLPYTDEAIEVVSQHIRNLKEKLDTPIAMENITHNFCWPGNHYTEPEFITKVLEKADCGLLLDITNLYINSKNLLYDPYEYLASLPKDRIMQLHVAGHSENNGKLIDSHIGGIQPDVLKYMEWIFCNTSCRAALIERDTELNRFDDLVSDLQVCKDIYNKYC